MTGSEPTTMNPKDEPGSVCAATVLLSVSVG